MIDVEEVRSFWEKNPCGSRLSDQKERRSYFNEIAEKRYKTEPHIPVVAKFGNYKGRDVLEIGCGMGTDAVQFQKKGARYVGVDLTAAAVRLSSEHASLYGLEANFLESNAERLPFPDNRFDHVYSFGVIHHSPDLDAVVREIRRVLKPGGTFSVMVYNKSSINYYLEIMFLRKVGRWLLIPKRMPTWLAKYFGFDEAKLSRHREILLKRDARSKEKWISINTDGPDCPLARVFDRKEALNLFRDFEQVKTDVWFFDRSHWPVLGRRLSQPVAEWLGKRWGWHRMIYGKKPARPEAWKAVTSFHTWLKRHGRESFDPYDLWATDYGCFARKIYYQNRLLSAPLVAPILFCEYFFPALRRIFTKKRSWPTANAHFVLAFINLYSVSGQRHYLEEALFFAEALKRQAIHTASGCGWGYPFDWRNSRGLWKRYTPFVTVTPYAMEAFLALLDATGDSKYLKQAQAAIGFIFSDIQDTPVSNAMASSYSPADRSLIINASAYRAFALLEGYQRFGEEAYKEKALLNLRFILQSQKADGSWLYAEENPRDAFIDHFHTCFVLKNLYKANRRLQSPEIRNALLKGYEYYRKNLFDPEGMPKPFARATKMQWTRFEMYDFAEAITLGTLLKSEIPDAFYLAESLAKKVCERFQLADGHFVTRVYAGGRKNTIAYLRWPQAQIFYALTNLLKTSDKI